MEYSVIDFLTKFFVKKAINNKCSSLFIIYVYLDKICLLASCKFCLFQIVLSSVDKPKHYFRIGSNNYLCYVIKCKQPPRSII